VIGMNQVGWVGLEVGETAKSNIFLDRENDNLSSIFLSASRFL
jgi:hypothetical protein